MLVGPFWVLCVGFCAWVQPLHAAPDWSALDRPHFRRLGFDDGLPHPIVTALAQDAQGFVWIGTQGGLARFDGHRLRTYPLGEGAQRDPYVQALQMDGQGQLWVGTRSAGLLRYRPDQDRFERVALAAKILALAAPADGSDTLWVASELGLQRWQRGQLQLWARPQGSIQVLRVAADGVLWVGGSQGLWRLRGRELVPVGQARGVQALAPGEQGQLWVGSVSLGLSRVRSDGQEVRVWAPEHPQLGGRPVQSLLQIDEEQLWAGVYGQGLARWPAPAGGSIRHDPFLPTSLSSDGVRVLMRDQSGLIWIGGDQGVDRYDPRTRHVVNVLASPRPGTGLPDRNVLHVGAGPDRWSWLLGYGSSGLGLLHTPAGGWARLEILNFRTLGDAPPLDGLRVLASAWLGEELWVGTLQGLYRVDWRRRLAERVEQAEGLWHTRVNALLADATGLWVAGSRGLLRRESGGWKAPPEAPPERLLWLSDDVNVLYRDDAQRLWIGADGGLRRWLGDARFIRFAHDAGRPESLCPGPVSTLHQDGSGRLWVGTLGGGLCRLDREAEGRFVTWTRKRGLPHDNIGSLLSDSQGRLWGSSADGLFSLDPKVNGHPEPRVLGLAEGVAVRSFWIDSAVRTTDDELIFGGGGGLVVLRSSSPAGAAPVPPLVLTDLRIDGQPQPIPTGGATLKLSPNRQGLQVEFAALDYAAAERQRYRYRLQGLSEEWTETDASRRLAAFGQLSPGRYTLQVQARGPDGRWQGLDLVMEQQPAWTQTWWARLSLVLAIAALVLLWLHGRTRLLRQRQQTLEAQVRHRTQELSQANETLARSAQTLRLLGDTGKALTAQLDPQSICALLHRQLERLVPLDAFGLALLDEPAGLLRFVYYFEGNLTQGDTVALDDPLSLSARAFREVGELEVLDEEQSLCAPEVAGVTVGAPMRSLVFRPLLLNERRIGIVTLQSRRPQAYGPQELEVFRSLTAYAAIAIGNAQAFEQLRSAQAQAEMARSAADHTLAELRSTQEQLVEHAKLASLGQLVAGVAHEVNTPLGIAVTANSHLGESVEALRAQFESGRMARSSLANFLDDAQRSSEVLALNLRRAADLITHFKEVSVDRTSDERRRFELGAYLGDLIESLRPSWKRRPIELQIEVEPELWMNSYPGALGQVVGNLIQNALLHAFEPEQAGRLRIEAKALGERVLLNVIDNGRGVAAEHLARLFDPFFTTRRGQGGTGLGLHISHNLVVQRLGGVITVHSSPGQGCRFELILPVEAP
ncbi:sensor histidine kinase [Inhella inkyongensis]|nr:two-component regulator propeller domain-containing protein [Inhella inkyongensis]